MAKLAAVIEGEDASPDAVRPVVRLIDRLVPDITWIYPPVGERGEASHGSQFPDEAKRMIDEADSTLFGATSGKSVQALLYLRWGKETYANVRPTKWRPGFRSPLSSPEEIDLVIVRENLEDMYLMVEGPSEELRGAELRSLIVGNHPADLGPGRYALKLITQKGAERIARYAFELARKRKAAGLKGRVVAGAKYNILPGSDGYFMEIVGEVASAYADIAYEPMLVDNLAHLLSAKPHSFDVILLPNLYGDILSDAAAGLVGGLGLAPSGCYGDDYAYFESVHGTAPDIAGKNIINPTATLLSAAMMLDYLEFIAEAAAVEKALCEVYAAGEILTPDQGGSASTTEFLDAVEARVR